MSVYCTRDLFMSLPQCKDRDLSRKPVYPAFMPLFVPLLLAAGFCSDK